MSEQQNPEEERNKWSLSNLAESLLGPPRPIDLQPVGRQIMMNPQDSDIRNEFEQKFSIQETEWQRRFEALQASLHSKNQELNSTQQAFQHYVDQPESLRYQQGNEFDSALTNHRRQLEQNYELKLRLISSEKQQLEAEKGQLLARIVEQDATIEELQQQLRQSVDRIDELLRQQATTPVLQQRTTARTISEDETGSVYSAPSFGRQSSINGPVYQQNVLHVNTETVDDELAVSSVSRKRVHQVPIFKGKENEDSYEWLLAFEKVALYYGWDDRTTLREFMMVLQGSAGYWWDSQQHILKKGTYEAARTAFTQFFGGDLQAQSRALANIDNLRQGSESMVSFGPKLFIEITRVSREPHIQLYFFYRIINSALADKIALSEPQSLQDAVAYGVRLERGAKERQMARYTGGVKGDIGPIVATPSVDYSGNSSGPQPMEGVVHGAINLQGQKSSRRIKGNCHNCGKKGHKAVDCYAKQKSSGRPNKQNTQTVSGAYEAEEEEGNIFARLYSSSQVIKPVEDANLPVFFANTVATDSLEVAFADDPRRFAVDSMINNRKIGLLADTGAMVSTINKQVAELLDLPFSDEPDSCIEYGNQSREISNKSVVVTAIIDGSTYKYKFLVVSKQNVPVLLGMDFFLAVDLALYPKRKSFISGQDIVKAIGLKDTKQQEVKTVMTVVDKTPAQVDTPEVMAIRKRFPNVFNITDRQAITNAPVEHTIDTGDAKPIVRRGRRLSPAEKKALVSEVKKMLDAGVVRESNSPWCSPPVMVPKPDETWRVCNNYIAVNQVTRKDKWPLPRMEDLVDELTGAKWFTSVDLKAGYWHIPIKEEDKCKTAFIAGDLLVEYNVMPFGLTNAPSTFARFMHSILGRVKNTIIYLDDILAYNLTKEENIATVNEIFEILDKWNLKVNIGKCKFFQNEVKFLGFIVSGTGIRSNPEKVEPIKKLTSPSSVKELQQFLGLCTFYHRFIKNLSSIASPLYKLLQKESTWSWTQKEESIFRELKETLMSLPELSYPNSNLPYEIHCDASNVGLGAVLVQAGRPIAFASKTLNRAQQNYSTTEKECMAVSWALQHFHCYVHGCHSLAVHTDHAALKQILSTKDPKGRIARWVMDITSYDFSVVHIKGSKNQDADALSRLCVEKLKVNAQQEIQLTASVLEIEQQKDSEIQAYLKTHQEDSSIVKKNNLWYKLVDKQRLVIWLPRSLVLTFCHLLMMLPHLVT